jgi:hypothetical protein
VAAAQENHFVRCLVACEESGRVTEALRSNGVEAWSCDLLPTSGNLSQYHIQDDVRNHLEGWDCVIAFPPCTDLAVSGAKHFARKIADGSQAKSAEFFMLFTRLKCRWAIENPVGIMSTRYRKPDQIIHPWQFGHNANKKTCIWLNGLPLLHPTNVVDYTDYVVTSKGSRMDTYYWKGGKGSGAERSKTFQGIADAMGSQWGGALQ